MFLIMVMIVTIFIGVLLTKWFLKGVSDAIEKDHKEIQEMIKNMYRR